MYVKFLFCSVCLSKRTDTFTFSTVGCRLDDGHLVSRARLTRRITRVRLEEPKPTGCTVVLITIDLVAGPTISLKVNTDLY